MNEWKHTSVPATTTSTAGPLTDVTVLSIKLGTATSSYPYMHVPLFPSRGTVYFPFPGIRSGLVTCLDQQPRAQSDTVPFLLLGSETWQLHFYPLGIQLNHERCGSNCTGRGTEMPQLSTNCQECEWNLLGPSSQAPSWRSHASDLSWHRMEQNCLAKPRRMRNWALFEATNCRVACGTAKDN